MIGTNHLTLESIDQTLTHPGQAHFAIPGDQRVCRDCVWWNAKKHTDAKAVCRKAAILTPRQRPIAVSRYATACKYFEAQI